MNSNYFTGIAIIACMLITAFVAGISVGFKANDYKRELESFQSNALR